MKRLKIKLLGKRTVRSRIIEAFRSHTDDDIPPVPVKIKRIDGGVEYTNPYGRTHWIEADELQRARDCVKRGSGMLDKYVPGWFEKLQLDALDISNCDICVCGQLALAADKKSLSPAQKEYFEEYGGEDWDLIWDEIVRQEGFVHSTQQATLHGFLSGAEYDGGASYPALEVEWHRLVTRRRKAAEKAAA